IATVTVLMSRAAWQPARIAAVLGAVTITCATAWLLMRGAARAERFLPKTLLRAFERIMGLLLSAVAIEFIAGGLREILRAPSPRDAAGIASRRDPAAAPVDAGRRDHRRPGHVVLPVAPAGDGHAAAGAV